METSSGYLATNIECERVTVPGRLEAPVSEAKIEPPQQAEEGEHDPRLASAWPTNTKCRVRLFPVNSWEHLQTVAFIFYQVDLLP